MTPLQHHIHRMKNKISIHSEILLSMVDVAVPQYKVMELVDEAGERKVASQATLVNSLTDLRKKGFVLFTKDKEDGRIKFVRMTKKGINYLDKSRK